MINEIYKGNLEDISLQLEILERSSGIHITIQNMNSIKYDSSHKFFNNNLKNRKIPYEKIIPYKKTVDLIPNIHKIPAEKYIFRVTKDPRLKTNFLNLISVLNNKDILILSTPLVAIQESADIANNFFLFTGILTLIIGGILAFILSKRFAKPILELNNIAKKMSVLDFSKKYDVKSNDEIGELGDSINSLSSQLDKTISDLKFANDKLEKDLERERKIDEMRKEFIANVSHELKTPLFLIQGYSEGLKLNITEDENERNFYCDVIMNETTKMNKLVKQLLELSQLESGNLKLEKNSFDIYSLLDTVINKFKAVLDDKEISIDIPAKDNIMVYADRDKIEQILVNYTTNAINHVDDKKQIKIVMDTIKTKVRISIFNSGKHIPEESIDEIWTSFYKVDKARTRAYGGTGLGLSVVRSIQNLHNNAYGVMNTDDGVVFWFELDKYEN
ncbi:sensor histidine kinase [Clostridium ganghwense]